MKSLDMVNAILKRFLENGEKLYITAFLSEEAKNKNIFGVAAYGRDKNGPIFTGTFDNVLAFRQTLDFMKNGLVKYMSISVGYFAECKKDELITRDDIAFCISYIDAWKDKVKRLSAEYSSIMDLLEKQKNEMEAAEYYDYIHRIDWFLEDKNKLVDFIANETCFDYDKIVDNIAVMKDYYAQFSKWFIEWQNTENKT